ncbi:MAG TPA: type I DNA topoisomerase [Candidatus Eisenbacteria bacterium]|nr:type I DNA topoisomerase [Candidatus Eisenbacteria bacterium]
MKLVVVESPTKAKTIGKFLGDGYEIRASMGHVMDLPKSTLGVDVEHNFLPQFEISEDKKDTIAELKKLAKTAEVVLLATDPDREGEAISANIEEVLRDANKSEKFQRIVFHEITKEAIEEALTKPGKVNEDLVAAQIARRVLDRLVGYKLSPLLWQKVRRGLSAGRVQSVALRLIVEREREIEKFGKEDYYTITVQLRGPATRHPASTASLSAAGAQAGSPLASPLGLKKSDIVDFELVEINDEKIEVQNKLKLYDGEYTVTKTTIDSKEKAEKIESDLQTKEYFIEDVLQKQTKRSPQPPFTTSTLQQQAAIRYGYSGKRTMSLAQKLYEEGYITYHRTDSLNMAESAVGAMRKYVEEKFGKKYIPEKPRFFANKSKNAQEAHEAIRPTKVLVDGEKVGADLGRDYSKLYDLIWIRAVASQMSDALVESTTVSVKAEPSSQFVVHGSEKNGSTTNDELITNNTVYRFKTSGSVLLFEGFLKINPFGLEDKKLPNFAAKDLLDLLKVLAESHTTTPPPRYNDASLIKSLEEGGIGRPSTYASIIGTIETRQYIERDQKRFLPTSVGMAVNDFLVKNFADIDDIPFTADMENKLDAVAEGLEKWQPMIAEFYQPFEKKLAEVKKTDRVEIPVEKTGEKCPKDGGDLVIRIGKFGKFISCANFPTCDFKKQYVEETGYPCPKDGGKIIIKKTHKGRPFYGCSNYPNCDYATWKLDDVKKGIIPEKKDYTKTVETTTPEKTSEK